MVDKDPGQVTVANLEVKTSIALRVVGHHLGALLGGIVKRVQPHQCLVHNSHHPNAQACNALDWVGNRLLAK